MGLFNRRTSESSGPVLDPVPLWGGSDWCNQQVAGESFHGTELRSLFGPASPRGVELKESALLIAEPANPHDPNAVAVTVRGVTVGYLPREDAARYQPLAVSLAQRGQAGLVDCRIWGQTFTDYEYDAKGRERQIERFSASVTIALAEPHLCIPMNTAPTEPHVMLPRGSAIQIQGEEDCMEAIVPMLRPEGAAMAHTTLHEIEPTTPKGKPLVEVRIDGQRVGQLTPKMSSDLLPAIRVLTSTGHSCVSQARVEGNRLKAEVVLYCARAHQLSADWPGPQAVTGAIPATHTPAHEPIPAKPTRIVFVAPPGWPPPPTGWEPQPGWAPEPDWPAAPAGWRYWQLAD